MIQITIGILGFLVVILGYTTINLLRKTEKSEDMIISQATILDRISTQIKESSKKLEEIDTKGVFEGDDEIGWFFNEIKEIQNNLTQLGL